MRKLMFIEGMDVFLVNSDIPRNITLVKRIFSTSAGAMDAVVVTKSEQESKRTHKECHHNQQ